MKKITALMFLGLASSAFCVDEYMPIEKGKTEVDVGYGYAGILGVYDSSGKKQDLPSGVSPAANAIHLQVKYGIMPGLDAEAAWTGIKSNKDGGDLGGFSQPDIALKYAMTELGAGAYLDFILPVATGNLDNPKPAMGAALGAVFAKTFGKFRATGTGSYLLNFENSDKLKPGNVLDLYFKPEFVISEFAGAYLGIDYHMTGKAEFNGTAGGTNSYMMTILPGWNATWLKWLSTEINVPYTLMGKSTAAAWGITANAYMTFPM